MRLYGVYLFARVVDFKWVHIYIFSTIEKNKNMIKIRESEFHSGRYWLTILATWVFLLFYDCKKIDITLQFCAQSISYYWLKTLSMLNFNHICVCVCVCVCMCACTHVMYVDVCIIIVISTKTGHSKPDQIQSETVSVHFTDLGKAWIIFPSLWWNSRVDWTF